MLYLVSVTNIHKIMRKTERLIEKLLVCFIMESMITRMEVFLNKKGKAAEQKFAEMVIIHYCFIIFYLVKIL